MSGGTRGRSFTGLFAPPKCAASGRVIQTGCQLWMIKIIGRLTRPCSGWPLPFTAHSPRGSAWCSTSRKAETMLGRSFSGKTARGPRRRGACGKGRRSTCPRFLACYSNTNKDCIERYERGEVKRRFSTQPRRVGTLRGDPRPAARCGERDFFRSNDDEYKQARLLSKSHHHYSPRAAKLNNARRAELPRGTASSAMVSPRPTSGGRSSQSQVKVYSSRRQESHVQRRRVTGAGAGARGCGPHHPPVSRKSPARDESSFGCVVQTRQFLFVFSLRCVGFSRSSVLKFPFKGSW